MKGYKVFNSDWTCREKQYSCPGIFKQKGRLRLCENGIHFCKDLIDCFNYYSFNPSNKVAEIETLGKVIGDEIQGKYCTSKIEIVKELNWHEVLDLINTGISNTGFQNSGDNNTGNYNIGNHNTGDYNSGCRNTGSRNFGYYNAGSNNFGDYNTSNFNSGDCNTGDCNSGYRNSGNYNSGSLNTGNYNSGHQNSGNHNFGNYNTGDYNIGDRNFGCFNTRKDNTKKNKMVFFDKQSDWSYENWTESEAKKVLDKMKLEYLNWIPECEMTKEEKEACPNYKVAKGFLRYREKEELNSLRQEWWNDLSKKDKEAILSMPNFDAKIFKEITGIDVTIEK